jgi:2-(1,2-epoxy-1,2-dihydrophenyl)acetyl-CoA isomerase
MATATTTTSRRCCSCIVPWHKIDPSGNGRGGRHECNRSHDCGFVATIVIRAAATKNAIDINAVRQIHGALDEIQKAGPNARALVITGGDGAFCSGVDLNSVDLERPEARQRAHAELRRFMDPLVLRFSQLRQPIIVGVNGAAVGAGMSLALVGDIIVVAEGAFLWPSFARVGLVPDGGITFRLARRIGGGRALSSLLLAEKIDAKTAHEWGLAYAVVPPSDLLNTSQSLARRLAAGPRSVLAHIRQLNSSAFDHSLAEQLRAERAAQERILDAHECVEGVRAFFEKRDPNFSSH